jgi:hypothetical protein
LIFVSAAASCQQSGNYGKKQRLDAVFQHYSRGCYHFGCLGWFTAVLHGSLRFAQDRALVYAGVFQNFRRRGLGINLGDFNPAHFRLFPAQ